MQRNTPVSAHTRHGRRLTRQAIEWSIFSMDTSYSFRIQATSVFTTFSAALNTMAVFNALAEGPKDIRLPVCAPTAWPLASEYIPGNSSRRPAANTGQFRCDQGLGFRPRGRPQQQVLAAIAAATAEQLVSGSAAPVPPSHARQKQQSFNS